MILSAQFANAERTAVTAITDDRGAVSMSVDAPEYLAWPGVTAPFVPQDLSANDLASLNAALAQDGSVVRALAEVVFAEVNVLRAAAGLQARTKPQFVAALKAQMRT